MKYLVLIAVVMVLGIWAASSWYTSRQIHAPIIDPSCEVVLIAKMDMTLEADSSGIELLRELPDASPIQRHWMIELRGVKRSPTRFLTGYTAWFDVSPNSFLAMQVDSTYTLQMYSDSTGLLFRRRAQWPVKLIWNHPY